MFLLDAGHTLVVGFLHLSLSVFLLALVVNQNALSFMRLCMPLDFITSRTHTIEGNISKFIGKT